VRQVPGAIAVRLERLKNTVAAPLPAVSPRLANYLPTLATRFTSMPAVRMQRNTGVA
jgi:hypothetical protein